MAYTTIDDPSEYFHIQLYTGNGSTNSITNDANAGDFKPDWVWVKTRNATRNHNTYDSSRGVTKAFEVNSPPAETTVPAGLTSFDTDGFTVGSDSNVNQGSINIVAWQWKANGGTTSSNTDGSITTTVQANTTAGFSIVTYTGNATDNATIGHGLGATPEWVLIKNRASSTDWAIGHKSIFGNNAENLRFTTGAAASAGDAAGSHFSRNAPSSTVITLGDGGDGDFSTDTNRAENHVAFCFTSIKGYSKFSSYIGNGANDGPFVYTGFKPAWVMTKRTDSTSNWVMHDNTRDPLNESLSNNNGSNARKNLYANLDNAEDSSRGVNFYSNGFKVEAASSDVNNSGSTYIYMSFAEHPFVSSEGVPVTAR